MNAPTETEHADLQQKTDRLRLNALVEVIRRWEAKQGAGVHLREHEARYLREYLYRPTQ
jgi:hypothetical protein